MKINRKQLRKIILESYRIAIVNSKVSKADKLTEGVVDDAAAGTKKMISDWIIKNKVELSEYFPYGTQTIAEKAIEMKAGELASCIVNIVNPF